MPRAFAFTETYSRTAYSDGPVTYYVFRPGLVSVLRTGIGQISTTDRESFEGVLREQRESGFRIVNRLPFPMPHNQTATLDVDVPQPIEISIRRAPYPI